jgi:hypothetical protein
VTSFGATRPLCSTYHVRGRLHRSIHIRDRLTHPKMPRDLEVSGEEIMTVIRAQEGFDALCHKCLDLTEA